MKKEDNIFQKLFGSFAVGSSRIPIRSNIYKGGTGYSRIGSTNSKIFEGDRKSPLLGNSSPSSLASGYYERLSELKGYQLLDIAKVATNFFSDYIINYLVDGGNGRQLVTILNEDGSNNDNVTDRINQILTKDVRILDFIRDHVQDYVFYGQYYSMLLHGRDEQGHIKFRVEEIHDPVAVITKKVRDIKGDMKEVFLAKGEDNTVYEIDRNEVVYIASQNLRLTNDLTSDYEQKKYDPFNGLLKNNNNGGNSKVILNSSQDPNSNRNKVLCRESMMTSEPLFYSLILKVKELIIKELLVSLISLRDLSSVQIFLLQFDKSIPLESANDLCARATKLANNTNEIASMLTSQFDIISFIENTMTQSAKFIPDYNSTLGGKNTMLPLDKLSDKLLEVMQTIDQCRNGVLGPLGLPSTLLDSTSGSKWQILQQSERANSRVSALIKGIKDSVSNLVCTIYRVIYNSELDPSLVKLHVTEKTSVEYNNQINQSESINSVIQGIANVLQSGLQVLDTAAPLISAEAYLPYLQNALKDIDPNTESLITEQSIQSYLQISQAKVNQLFEQYGLDPNQQQ